MWRVWVCLLCDTNRTFAKLRCTFARKSRTCAYGNINSWQACLSVLCWFLLPAKAFFLKQSGGRYSGSQLFAIAGHRERERERERCVFSERGHTNSAIVYLSIHCAPLPLKCNLICIQINHFSPIIFYRGSLLTVSICIFCTTCACVDLCKIMMVRDFLRFQFWLTFN